MRPRLTADALVAGRYQLLEPVADRGLGETWRVADRRREVGLRSIKFLAETPDGATPEGALAAIRALAVMRHGAIPSALQHGVHGGRPWVVFHDVRGESVGALLERARDDGELPDLTLLRWVFDAVAGAMAKAHAASLPLTHGALTPGSVIVLGRAARGIPCAVLDVGLAPWLDPPAGERAPEFVSGVAASVAADVYGLGALLTAMLTLPAPTGRPTAAATARRRRSDVPNVVWRVLATATSPEPDERYESVASLTAALDAAWSFASLRPAPRTSLRLLRAALPPSQPPAIAAPISSRRNALVAATGLIAALAVVVVGALQALLG